MNNHDNDKRPGITEAQELAAVRELTKAARYYVSFNSDERIEKVRFSDELRHILGYKDATDFPDTLQSWMTYIYPEDKEEVTNLYKKAIWDHTGQTPFDHQYRMIKKNGEPHWIRSACKFFRDEQGKALYCVGIYEDVNDTVLRLKAEQRLHEANKHLMSHLKVIETLSESYQNIYIIDRKNKTIEILKLGGYITSGLAKGHNGPYPYATTCQSYIRNRVYPDDIPLVSNYMEWDNMIHGVDSKKRYEFNYRVLEKGEVRIYQGSYQAVDRNSIVAGFQCIGQIVRKERERNEELARAKKQAEDANSAKTSFLFNMSHDIRTPMNAIIGFRDLLEKHQNDPVRRADYLAKIEDASIVLLSIINNVLEMARIEKGTLEIDETAWSAEQFNDTIYSIFIEMMKQKGLEFTRQIIVEHHYVYCDPLKLREIFINILSNAYKYTQQGKVNMHLEEIPSPREGWALYQTTITDTGMGMSEEFLPHIFEEFSREQNTTQTKIEGTGLGMPIVKRLVELLDGTIEVSSKKGEGTTFVVTIPHRIADRSSLVEHGGIEIDPNLFKGKRILLAEDNDLNAEIAIEILGEAGFVIDHAYNGRQCVDMLLQSPAGHYDLILMDIQMPQMNGYEATRTIRMINDPAKASIPILAMTANAFEEDKREAIRSGMNGHLPKPINVNLMMRELATLLS